MPVTAKQFAASLYQGDDRAAVVIIPRDCEDPNVTQRIFSASSLVGEKVQSWLRFHNAKKADIYLSMNPIREDRWKREKSDIGEIRRVYIDIDDDGPKRLAQLRRDVARRETPQPHHVVESSPERYQVIWNLARPPPPERAEQLMRQLVQKYGADPAAVDISRVMRWPGFRNHKRGGPLATVRSFDAPKTDLEEFRNLPTLDDRPERAPNRGRANALPPGRKSQSERDWAMVHRRLDRGDDPARIEADLAGSRTDKPKPAYYAARTVARALERRAHEPQREQRGGPER